MFAFFLVLPILIRDAIYILPMISTRVRLFIFSLLAFSSFVLISFTMNQRVYAAISSCNTIVNPSSIPTNTSQEITFTVTNSDESNNANWIQFQTPFDDLTITGGSSSGWGVQNNGSTATFVDGSLSAEDSGTFSITISSGSNEVSAQSWTILMSDTSGGSAVTCGGNHTTAISGVGFVAPEISNVSVSNVATTSVTISFTTSAPATSAVNYGSDDNYGSTSTQASATTHTHEITGLTANTTYHYEITVSNDGGSSSTDDATFTTALSSSATSTPGPTSTPLIQTTTLPTPTPTPDTKKPVVTLQTLPPTPFKTAPTINGNAVDNHAVTSVEYTVNGGKTWNRISSVSGLITSTATYSFTPVTDSTTQTITVRAKDTAGNIGTSNNIVLTIDQAGPTISMSTDLSKPFTKTPKMIGQTNDPSGESSVEYSIDNGKSWIPVDSVSLEHSTTTVFTFTPPVVDDGNYPILIKAKDSLTNETIQSTNPLIIDRLPPRIGGKLLSIGPQILSLTKGTVMQTITHTPHKLTLSFVGGPIEVIITAQSRSETVTTPLTLSTQTGLWSGELIFPSQGLYTLSSSATDGAGNQTSSPLFTVQVDTSGNLVSQKQTPVYGTVTLLVKDPETSLFDVWDARSYGQKNPVTVSPINPTFSFFPPAGTYAFRIDPIQGFVPSVTTTFTLSQPIPLNPTFVIDNSGLFSLLRKLLPIISRKLIVWTPYLQTTNASPPNPSNPRILPSSQTFQTTEGDMTFDAIRQQTTTLLLTNTWSPGIHETLAKLNDPENTYILVPHESIAALSIFKSRGNYPFTFIADPDGDLLEVLSYPLIPTTYQINPDLSISL